MGAAMVEMLCAYCGQPLQVVAGFCARCQAPIEIASHAKLVARALRQVHQPPLTRDTSLPPMPIPATLPPVPAALPVPPVPLALLPTRMLLCGGIVALALVVIAVSLRLGVNPIRALVAPSAGELTVSLTPGGDMLTIVTVGTPFILHYTVTVEAASALVTLSIAPAGLPTRSLAERWPRGINQRTQSLVAVTAGVWHISVTSDATTVRQIDLTVAPTRTSMINRSSNPFAAIALLNPPDGRRRAILCG